MRPLAALLALSLALGAPGPTAYEAFAADARTGGGEAGRGGWSAYAQAQVQAMPFAPRLGLDLSRGRTLEALVNVLENTRITPEAVLAQATPAAQAAMVRDAVMDYADRLMLESSLVNMEYWQSPAKRDSRLFPVGPWTMNILNKQFGDLREIIAVFPREHGLEVLKSARETRSVLSSMRVQRAMQKVQALDKLWHAQDAESDAQWRSFERLVEEVLPSEAHDHRMELDWVLQHRENSLAAARGSPTLTSPQRLVADAVLAGQVRRTQAWRWMLATGPDQPQAALSYLSSGRTLSAQDRELLEGIRPYVPMVDSAMAVANVPAFRMIQPGGSAVSGWVLPLWSEEEGSPVAHNMMSLTLGRDPVDRVTVAVHEAFHQGDREYTRAILALKLLIGPGAGEELARILIEGVTEYRARVSVLRMLQDGYEGKNPFAQSFAASVRRQLKPESLEDAKAKLRRLWEPHHYSPYVELVQAIAGQFDSPAVDVFVREGDARPLARGLGAKRLRLLGLLSALHRRYDFLGAEPLPSARARLAEASGLSAWLAGKMKDAVEGRLQEEAQVQALEAVAEEFLAKAESLLRAQPSNRQMLLLEALRGTDFDAYLAESADKGRLAELIAEDLGLKFARQAPAASRELWITRLRAALWYAAPALAAALAWLSMRHPAGKAGLPLWAVPAFALASVVFLHLYWAYVAATRGLPRLFQYLSFAPAEFPKFPKIAVVEELGSGAAGKVYKGKTVYGRPIAVKVLDPYLIEAGVDLGPEYHQAVAFHGKGFTPAVYQPYTLGPDGAWKNVTFVDEKPSAPIHAYSMQFIDGPNPVQALEAGMSQAELEARIDELLAKIVQEGKYPQDARADNLKFGRNGVLYWLDQGGLLDITRRTEPHETVIKEVRESLLKNIGDAFRGTKPPR